MADAGTIGAVISGVVSLISAYMTYRVGMKQAEQKEAAKPDDETLTKGEQAMAIVRTGVAQYGDEDEKADLANFERNPQRYEDNLARVLTDIAMRTPVFRQELESLTKQLDIQTGGVQGNVNVSGQGRIYGPSAGVNPGTMTGSYTFNDRDDAK